ncbi:SRPBCC family protein [Nonomuraea sp. NPDC046802]|uniref:SRPBCC family protein n=1 Tax=Nonomuraea sp. NPDC046802 TaxID=3154919 RepID=UPI0033C47EB7
MAMRFEHEFTVPVPIEQAWAVLLDVERVAPCLPGATLDTFEGDEFTGRMKVKVGPIMVTYKGTARFEDVDKDSYALAIQASGKEARGSGTASATVRARMTPAGESTKVSVETSFNVTGRPAQFGRGVMAEVGGKLIEKFAGNLAELLSEPTVEPVREEEPRVSVAPSEQDVHPAGTMRTSLTPDEEALDLLEVAGQPLLKRLAPIAGAVAVLLIMIWVIRRIRR